jgi:hypothetical protein
LVIVVAALGGRRIFLPQPEIHPLQIRRPLHINLLADIVLGVVAIVACRPCPGRL